MIYQYDSTFSRKIFNPIFYSLTGDLKYTLVFSSLMAEKISGEISERFFRSQYSSLFFLPSKSCIPTSRSRNHYQEWPLTHPSPYHSQSSQKGGLQKKTSRQFPAFPLQLNSASNPLALTFSPTPAELVTSVPSPRMTVSKPRTLSRRLRMMILERSVKLRTQ